MNENSECSYVYSRGNVIVKHDLWCSIDTRHVQVSYLGFVVQQETFSEITYFDMYCLWGAEAEREEL